MTSLESLRSTIADHKGFHFLVELQRQSVPRFDIRALILAIVSGLIVLKMPRVMSTWLAQSSWFQGQLKSKMAKLACVSEYRFEDELVKICQRTVLARMAHEHLCAPESKEVSEDQLRSELKKALDATSGKNVDSCCGLLPGRARQQVESQELADKLMRRLKKEKTRGSAKQPEQSTIAYDLAAWGEAAHSGTFCDPHFLQLTKERGCIERVRNFWSDTTAKAKDESASLLLGEDLETSSPQVPGPTVAQQRTLPRQSSEIKH
eukprot:TRINITY_DN82282_c0_g1_i1.p1 TRINITY_DN82282_c0_g1~~TRINITY_DN82282_c0_g1_i1.p1  ORF type:complete len:263 (-),score=30.80 TRINITY_DN82282_c0_g1_i1:279-1067(-)